MRREVVANVVASGLLLGLVLTGCASSSTVDGAIENIDGGRQITVPVLWADPSSGAGGLEPATVWVGDRPTTGFAIDLLDLEAEGAGAAWTAASSTAAAVGTLYSGRDPRDIDVAFAVSGPIDGPSAGAFLTVAILAALRDVPLRPGVTMTGTVSPDGTISAVGGVGLKLQAAAEAGYSTVLLPPGNTTLTVGGTGESIAAVDAGRELGLDVRHVATIAQAYEAATGDDFITVAAEPYALPAVVRAAAEQTARDLVRESTALAEQVPTDAPERAIIDDDLRAAVAALDAGDPASAYARAAEALFAAGRAVAVDEYRELIQEQGVAAAKTRLSDDVDRSVANAETAIAEGSDISGLGIEAAISTPSALTWSAYALAALRGLAAAVPDLTDADELLAAVTVLSEQSLSVDYLQPDALEVVRAMPSRQDASDQRIAAFLSGYTNFLVRGARANAQYIEDVVLPSVPAATVGIDDVRSLAPILRELARETQTIDVDTEPIDAEVAQSAIAITDFVATTSFISATQGFGLDGFNMVTDAPTITDPDAVRVAFNTSRGIVADLAALVSEQGSDAGYAVWSAQWGAAAFEGLALEGRAGTGAVLAFNELWFDAVNLQMIFTSAEALKQTPAPS